MVGRHRRPVAPCDGARAALVMWLRDVLDEDGRSDASLADDIQYDRSSVSRALSGRVMPSRPLVLRIAGECGASADTAERLWAAADANRRQRPAREADGHPPVDLADYPASVRALRDLFDQRGISQREVERRDQSGLLRRSTVGTHLRLERPLSRDVTLAMVRACGVTETAVAEWADMWDQLGRPHLANSVRQRSEIYRRSQYPYVYRDRRGGNW